MPLQPYTLADIDGTIPGRAALLSMNLLDYPAPRSGPGHHVWIEGQRGVTNPIREAEILRDNIAPTLPGYQFTIISTPRARYLYEVADEVTGTPWRDEHTIHDYLDLINELDDYSGMTDE